MTSDVLCSHSFSFLCSADIAAISAQCGWPSRLAAGAVRPTADSATEFHLTLCVRVDLGQRFEHNVAELRAEGLAGQQIGVVPNTFRRARLFDTTPNVEQSSQVELSDEQSVVAIE